MSLSPSNKFWKLKHGYEPIDWPIVSHPSEDRRHNMKIKFHHVTYILPETLFLDIFLAMESAGNPGMSVLDVLQAVIAMRGLERPKLGDKQWSNYAFECESRGHTAHHIAQCLRTSGFTFEWIELDGGGAFQRWSHE